MYLCTHKTKTVVVAQLVRASDCGSEGRGFETHHPPKVKAVIYDGFFYAQKYPFSFIKLIRIF
ncbi:hypothetical protein E27107_200094 [Elizabethkingia anophelis]|nr:hypothetical protein E18064_360096 [Elizabethkingia anophelis]CDN77441.1 hypothetical protein E27107_200094 [Elizabethkingia anophelis]